MRFSIKRVYGVYRHEGAQAAASEKLTLLATVRSFAYNEQRHHLVKKKQGIA